MGGAGQKGRLTAGFTRGRRFTCHSEAQAAAAAVRRPSLHTWPCVGQGHFRKRGGRSFLDIGAVPTLSAAARHPRPRGPLCHLPVRATTSWLSRAHGALPVLPPPSSSSAAPCLLTARRSPVGSVRLAGHRSTRRASALLLPACGVLVPHTSPRSRTFPSGPTSTPTP